MPGTREQVADALMAKIAATVFPAAVNGSMSFVETSRQLQLFDTVDSSHQPAAFLIEHAETYEQPGRGIPPRRILTFSIFCYARSQIGSIVGGTVINNMLLGIENALVADDIMSNLLTLGGLVQWCNIQGVVFKDPGDLDNQAMLIVPIRVVWP
jgi:hypothetical protein